MLKAVEVVLKKHSINFYLVGAAARMKGWDGMYKGRVQNPEVFVWVCRYQLEGEAVRLEKGAVTLIR